MIMQHLICSRALSTLKALAALTLATCGWTVAASVVFLYGAGLTGAYSYPLYQWWIYLIFARGNPLVAIWLIVSGGLASIILLGVVARLALRSRALGPSLRRGLIVKRRSSKRSATDNHGYAEWLTIDKARELLPGPSPAYGGVVVGEAYRVDQDKVAKVAFDPGKRSTWGKGGRTALLIDPCKSGPTHSLVFAGAGSFKSTSAISTLLTWTGSVVVLDPSCELGPMLAAARKRMGQAVHQVGLSEVVGFNVLDWIDIHSPRAVTNVLSVTGWICGDAVQGGEQTSSFFASRGRALVSCLLAHMLWDPKLSTSQKTLSLLRKGIATPERELRDVLANIHENSHSSLARDYAGTLMGLVSETFSGVYANADEATAWLANPAFADMVSADNFRSLDLLDGKTTVFLQISLDVLQSTPAIGRTVIGALLNAAYEADGRVSGRILYLLDEVARLGPMKILETARDAGRKYGITLQLLYQSVGQLEKQWGKDGKREWYDGVSHRTYAAIQDLETARELEETFGSYSAISTSEGMNSGSSGKFGSRSKGSNINYQEISRPLIRKDELINCCRTDEAFVVLRGAKPLRCGRAIYFRRPELRDKVSSNRFVRSTA